MKYFGILCILTASTMLGFRAADKLTGNVRLLQALRALVSAMCTELRGDLPTVSELLRRLAAQERFSALAFLREAAGQADAFPESWEHAVSADPALTEETRGILRRVGQTLGSTTLEGQLAALSLCAEQLSALQRDAEHAAEKKGTLCRSFGVLAGMFVVILLL